MENYDEKTKKEDIIADAEVMPKKLSTPEFARQVEEGIISPATLSQKDHRRLALYYQSVGYENDYIAVILKVTIRTVQRKLKKIKDDNSLMLGSNFQKNLIVKVMRSFETQRQRLLRASCAKDLSSYEKVLAIEKCIKAEVGRVVLFEKIGCISKRRTEEFIAETKTNSREERLEKFGDLHRQLTKDQQIQVSKFIDDSVKEKWSKEQEFSSKLDNMFKTFAAENKKMSSRSLSNSTELAHQVYKTDKVINTCAADIYANAYIIKATETTAPNKSN